jgi:hypothetical protein
MSPLRGFRNMKHWCYNNVTPSGFPFLDPQKTCYFILIISSLLLLSIFSEVCFWFMWLIIRDARKTIKSPATIEIVQHIPQALKINRMYPVFPPYLLCMIQEKNSCINCHFIVWRFRKSQKLWPASLFDIVFCQYFCINQMRLWARKFSARVRVSGVLPGLWRNRMQRS